MSKRWILLSVLIASMSTMLSCGNKKLQPEPIYYDDFEEDYNTVQIPYKEYGGVKTIQVKINDCIEFPMIFDTGCSGLSLSVHEVYALAKQGCISSKDIVGYEYATIANGTVVKDMVVKLNKIRIGDLVCKNVRATVSDNENAPLLLGNGVLDNVYSFQIDNVNKTIKFQLR